MKPAFSVLVCGYGIPEDILTDRSYHAYLVGVTNWLFEHHGEEPGRIVLVGGATDVVAPFKRTEAGEMAKWFEKRIRDIASWTGRKPRWDVVAKPKALSSVENLLAFKPFAKGEAIIFCEATRAPRIRKLSKAVFGKKSVTVIPVDFDGSPRRYLIRHNARNEAAFTRAELRAVHDPRELERIRAFMKEKLAAQRSFQNRAEAYRKLPDILMELHQKYRF